VKPVAISLSLSVRCATRRRGRERRFTDKKDKGEKGEREIIMEIRHYKFQRITLNPEKCFGKPCIRGLRMPVASILSYLSSGMTVEAILDEWPELEQEDIYRSLGLCRLGNGRTACLPHGSSDSMKFLLNMNMPRELGRRLAAREHEWRHVRDYQHYVGTSKGDGIW
jgi:uncharacterized protein (DUF433 family)